MSIILGIDYGKKRTGIALTDPLKTIASSFQTIETKFLIDFLRKFVEQKFHSLLEPMGLLNINVPNLPIEKIKGAGERYEDVRLSIPKFKVEIVNGIPRVFSQDSSKATNKNFILRGPREFFKTILGGFVKPVEPIVKGVEGVNHMEFDREDSVRHPLVKRILKTYEDEHRIDLSKK